MSARTFRRVVTGLDAEGKSCVIIDGDVPRLTATGNLIWRSGGVPADNSDDRDTATPFTMDMMRDGGTNFQLVEWPAGARADWHATNTLDYIAVLEGAVVVELEKGEVTIRAGEFLVDRGVLHAWRNDGPDLAVCALVTVPAHPVGRGGTI
jgi:quercetin dioxygenase-like cupin family protein